MKTKTINKLLSIILVLSLLLNSSLPLASAEENTGSEEIAAEQTQNENTLPTPTVAQNNELQAAEITETPTPTMVAPTAIPTPTRIPEPGDPNRTQSASSAFTLGVNPTPTKTPTPAGASGNIGTNTEVETGDSTNTANLLNNANNNLSNGNQSSGIVNDTDNSGANIINSANGANSDNNNSATLTNDTNTNQTNSAAVNTNLNQTSQTGLNNASYNVGGNSSINTGDANTTGTVISAVNTNADAVMVSEFNIVDDHVGDILLDFAANCISGCFDGSIKAANTENGSNSDNNTNIDQQSTDNTFQSNDAYIGSELNLSADTGNNTASSNTGGNSNITTGDANVAANVLNFANNNIAGDVVYAVVNIFGDLVGDILFPEDYIANCCGNNINASNQGNGSDSENNTDLNSTYNENTFQINDANIANNLIFDAQTGNNSTSDNTGGDSMITTGNTYVDANVLNVANTNLEGGNMWLVLVNEAGNWIGKILGASEDTNYAGSQGTEFNIDDNGIITATNAGNGTGSTNNSDIDITNTENTTQTNNANINNNLNLSANTGGNEANKNTGGNSNITTGDATIIANLVNFVNNNIKGNGKLFVSVVNVFGSWFGDFVTPGQKKDVKTVNQPATGGPSSENNSTSQNNPASDNNAGQKTDVNSSQHNKVNNLSYAVTYKKTNSTKPYNDSKVSLVKGATHKSTAVLADTTQNGKIRINLAWVVLVIAAAVAVIFIRKLFYSNILSKNK